MVSLFESGLSETLPTVRSVNSPGSFEGNIEVAALDGKVKPSTLVLHEMQCDLLQSVGLTDGFERSEARTSGYPFCCKYAIML